MLSMISMAEEKAVSEAKAATKADLRREIQELREIGGQMSNICFNLGQNAVYEDLGKMVTGRDLVSLRELQQQWDAIKRAENQNA